MCAQTHTNTYMLTYFTLQSSPLYKNSEDNRTRKVTMRANKEKLAAKGKFSVGT